MFTPLARQRSSRGRIFCGVIVTSCLLALVMMLKTHSESRGDDRLVATPAQVPQASSVDQCGPTVQMRHGGLSTEVLVGLETAGPESQWPCRTRGWSSAAPFECAWDAIGGFADDHAPLSLRTHGRCGPRRGGLPTVLCSVPPGRNVTLGRVAVKSFRVSVTLAGGSGSAVVDWWDSEWKIDAIHTDKASEPANASVIVIVMPVELGRCMVCEWTSVDGETVRTRGLVLNLAVVRCLRPSFPIENVFTLRVGADVHALSAPFVGSIAHPLALAHVTLTLATIIKHEPMATLLEWIAYNRHAGVERVALYDNSGQGAFAVLEELFPGFVYVIPWPAAHSLASSYSDSIYRFGVFTTWLSWYDPDEYLARRVAPSGGPDSVHVLQPLERNELRAFFRNAGPGNEAFFPWVVMGPCDEPDVGGGGRVPLLGRCTRQLHTSLVNGVSKAVFRPPDFVSNNGFGPHGAHPPSNAVFEVPFVCIHLQFLSQSEFTWRRREDAVFKDFKAQPFFEHGGREPYVDWTRAPKPAEKATGVGVVDGRPIVRFGRKGGPLERIVREELGRAALAIWESLKLQ